MNRSEWKRVAFFRGSRSRAGGIDRSIVVASPRRTAVARVAFGRFLRASFFGRRTLSLGSKIHTHGSGDTVRASQAATENDREIVRGGVERDASEHPDRTSRRTDVATDGSRSTTRRDAPSVVRSVVRSIARSIRSSVRSGVFRGYARNLERFSLENS